MSTLPQKRIGNVQNSVVGVTIAGSSGIAVTGSGASYTVSYTQTAPLGTVLQSTEFDLVVSFQPKNVYSATYNVANQFGTVSLTTLASNSIIMVEPAVITLNNTGPQGISAAFWVNGTGTPIGGGAILQGPALTYDALGGFFSVSSTTLGATITINACAFYSPGASTGSLCNILGSNSGYAYLGSLQTKIIVSEVQA
jgi:hypothetical protein